MAEKTTELRDFLLKPGHLLSIMLSPDERTFNGECLYVGMLPNQTLIMTPANAASFPALEREHKLIVRIATNNGTLIFATYVLNMTAGSSPIIFLQKPAAIKYTANEAVGTMGLMLPILASNSDTGIRGVTGTLDNLKMTKARLSLDKALGEPGHNIIIKGKFAIGQVNKMVAISANIVSMKEQNDKHTYAIKFNEEDESTFLILFGFIFSEMSQ